MRDNNEEELDQQNKEETISPASEHHEADSVNESLADEKQNEEPVASSTEDSVKSKPIEADSTATDDTVTSLDEVDSAENSNNDAAPIIENDTTEKVEAKGTVNEDSDETEDSDEEEDKEDDVDYSTCSKEELVELVKEAGHMDNVVKADRILMEIKPFFDTIRSEEREVAKEKFIKDGGVEDDFEFKNDELNTRFDANFRLIKDKKSTFYKEREKLKEQNLKKKEEVLEKLRDFVDSDETNISFDTFKQLQNEWKSIGQISNTNNKSLWANYNALLDRFYDKRSIYFELKELDRKKNLEAKLELCEKAEKLVEEKQLKIATHQLNELHEEFKHIGPVPQEDQEPLWQRFKAASDAIYDKRKEYFEGLKADLEENLIKKEKLSINLEAYTEFDSDRIKDWNEKTKEILGLQKEWDQIGGLPREKGKEINRRFWSSFKTFFHNKGNFFKRLDEERGENLKLKEELVKRAIELKDSSDWMKAGNELKKLQTSWKEIGPVPEKQRNQIYKRFKEACDHFFNQRREHNQEEHKDYAINLKKKEEICAQIELLAKSKEGSVEQLRELQANFNEVGFVPKEDISKIKSKYADAVDRFINAIPEISNEERHQSRLENQLNKMMSEPI